MKKINRKIVKHPKGVVCPKTVAGMFLERIDDFETVLVMGIKKGEGLVDFTDWSTLKLKELTYFKSVLDYEVNKAMHVED